MTEQLPAEIAAVGSLSAKIIRKCPTHRECPLTCKLRQVEDLGEIASFDLQSTEDEQRKGWRQKFVGWMAHLFSGGTSQ